jgi:hypothetical protein
MRTRRAWGCVAGEQGVGASQIRRWPSGLADRRQDREVGRRPDGVEHGRGGVGIDGEQRRLPGVHTVLGEQGDGLEYLGAAGVQEQLVHETGPAGDRGCSHGVASSCTARRGSIPISRAAMPGGDRSTNLAQRRAAYWSSLSSAR